MTTNREGLTWSEWFRATYCHTRVERMDRSELRKLHAAWKAGEDPSEWRAHFEHERAQALKDAGR